MKTTMSSLSRSNSWTRLCNGVAALHSPISARSAVALIIDARRTLTFAIQLTDQFEGSLIRVFRRLQELIRQMSQAAKVIGNSELQEKFEKASEMLERPNSVIFCSSLYL